MQSLEYSNQEIPNELILVMKGLSDKDRMNIFLAIIDSDGLTFSEIQNKFEINPSSLSNNLKMLQKGNLIHNFYKKSSRRDFSYYAVTEIGRYFFDSLLDTINKISQNYELSSTKITTQDNPSNTNPPANKNQTNYLSSSKHLLLIQLHDKPTSPGDMAKDLNKTPQFISNILQKMKQDKLITFERIGVRKQYRLTSYGKSLYEILSTHDAGFQDLIVEYNNKKRN